MATNNLDIMRYNIYPCGIELQYQGYTMIKKCYRCQEEKSIKKFKVDKRTSDGRTITCRYCYTFNKLYRFFRSSEQIESQRSKLLGRKYSVEHRKAISKGTLKAMDEGRHVFKKRSPNANLDNLRKGIEYNLWRENVLNNKGNLCESCNSKDKLHVHHIKCFYSYPDLRTDINNGKVLCSSCHMKLTWKERKQYGGKWGKLTFKENK